MADTNVELDNLTKEVGETEGVIDSAITFITGVADMIRAANTKNDPAFKALADKLDAKQQALAAAIAANSPPPPPPQP